MKQSPQNDARVLRGAGLRVTASRLAVLAALAESPAHASADQLEAAVRARIGDTTAQTIYNVLRALSEAGLVRRIEPVGSPGRYELRAGDNHHHVVCRRCGAIADVDCVVGTAPCLEPSSASGFLLDEAEVTFWGLCPRCRKDGAGDRVAHVDPAERVVRTRGGGARGMFEVTADET